MLDETDVLLDDLQEWKRPDLYENRPPPLVIEVFVDTANLAQNQALVIVDDTGRRWDVADALSSAAGSSPPRSKNGSRFCEVVLERWTIQLGAAHGYTAAELKDPLPNVYKKGVVLFRSLYTMLRFLPTWKLYKKLGRQALKLKYRIRQGHGLAQGQKDSLSTPLCPSEHNSDQIVEHHENGVLVTPAGLLSCVVDYRVSCGLDQADTESLLSSRFLGLDEGMPTLPAGRSLPGGRAEQRRSRYSSTVAPTTTLTRERPRGLLGAYGSLGTFHATDKRGSPVTELKQRTQDAEDENEDDDMDRLDRIRDEEGASFSRRKSANFITNSPFKGGSLASSPRPSPSPSTSVGKATPLLDKYSGTVSTSSSKRASLNTLPQQNLRTPSSASNEVAVASPSSSAPKPAPSKYSSSFSNRTRRLTSQSSKTGDSNASSGRGSSDSKEKSGQLNEGTAGSSGSAKTDDEDIATFLSDIDVASKSIKFNTPPSARDNVVNLSKYSMMRDPSTQLAEEMSSSSLIQTSITPPSRRLSNVPGLSTSSSPSRALAQHAPHVRSRLSTHSIVEEPTGASGTSGEGSDSPKIHEDQDEEDDELPFIFPHDNFSSE